MKSPSTPTETESPPAAVRTLFLHISSLLADGRAQQALREAEVGLAALPPDAELHNLAGVCAAALGEHDQAERYWRQAIALDPGAAQAYYNLGLGHAKRGHMREAEENYRKSVELDPGNSAALSNLGNLLAGMRRGAEAEQCYRKLLALDPGNAAAHSNLGVLLANRGQDDEAEQCYRKAIAFDPAHAKAFSNLGILLARGARHDEAELCYRKAIVLDPATAEPHTNLGLLLEEQKRYDQAEHCHRLAIALKPDQAAIHANLGNLLARLRRDEEAEACYQLAIALDPDSASAHASLGVMLTNLGREEEAERCLRRAAAVDTGNALARLNLGFLLLRQGRYAEGWRHHEARYHPTLPDQDKFPYPIKAPFPQWRGEALAGKTLLVWPEQGLGDEIQFCRYLPLLKQQGAARITLVCKTPLKDLMATLQGVDTVIAVNEAADAVAAHDYWTYPLSIPLHCKTDLTNIPARLPYLRAAPDRIARWSARLPRGDLRVGLAWKGNRNHANDRHRSLPHLANLAPLWAVPGVRFVSLQKGQGEDEARDPPPGQPLLDLGAAIADFADTAAIVAQLDLVICVDSAVAHLAGALAKPCWVLLPAYQSDWRWLQGRGDSPWYPGVVRLFRQARDEDWTAPIQDIKNALMDEAAKPLAATQMIEDNAPNELR